MSGVGATRRQILLAGPALLAVGCERGGTRLRAADTQPDGYPTVEAVAHMVQLLSERSGGRLRIVQFPGGQLGEEKGTLELTIFGGIDLNRVNLAPLNGIIPETLIPTLPYLFRSVAHMRAAMAGAPGRRILEAMEPHGLVGLCFYESGARGFYTRRRPVREPADLRGQKIRVQNSDVNVRTVQALGGSPTPMGFGEVYQALLQGVVDGAENNWPSCERSRHYEAAPLYADTRHVIAPEVLAISRRRWEKLSPDDRDLVRGAAEESVAVMQRLWDARELSARQALLAAGVTETSVDLAAFAALTEPVWADFLTTPGLRRLAEDIRAFGEAA